MIRNQSGQSLVQVLVAVGIMGIVMMAMQSMFATLNTESRALNEKLGTLDLEKVMIASLADGSVCKYVMQGPSAVPFDSTAPMTPDKPLSIVLPSPAGAPATLYATYTPANGAVPEKIGPVVAQVGQQPSASARTLVIKQISLQLTGKGSSPDQFTGYWEIDFDGTKLVRALKPVMIATTITADITSPTSAKVAGCQGNASSGAAAGGDGQWCGAFTGSFNGGGGVNKVLFACKGTTPSCPAGTSMYQGFGCKDGGGVFHDYDSSTVCPTGYTLTTLIPYTDPLNGGFPSTFFTCTAKP
jgi:hypothetical protein